MAGINHRLLEFFTSHHKPGIIGIVGTTAPVGLAIRQAQRGLTEDGEASLWSHCFILGEMRLDRRGAGGTKSRSPYIFESDLHLKALTPQVVNGAQENWVGKWCGDEVEHAAIIDFRLSDDERDMVLATARQLVDEQIGYAVLELLGTWWAIYFGKQWLPNPFDDPHAMYCSAFVRHCYMEAGRDFLGGGVSVSNTAPEHIAKAASQIGAMVKFSFSL